MKITRIIKMGVIGVAASLCASAGAARVDVYPQSFEAGGWGLDAQFMDVMGSPYLIAHGLGVRVLDAKARVTFPKADEYRVWVRTRNWADGNPGRFRVLVDGKPLAKEFGVGPRTWSWEDGGVVQISGTEATVTLEDLTGFDGRCAGIVFDSDVKGGKAPEGALKINEADVAETVKADFVVVGGGMPGTCAAVAAARRGIKVALVQDRPVLGGNASGEIRVYCAGEAKHDLIRELRGYFMNRDVNIPFCDARRMRIVQDEKNIEVRLLTRAFGVEKKADGTIAAVKALDLKSNRVIRFEAPLFCDATGDGWVGYWAGADWRMGREAKGEYDESRAPEKPDGDTLGASVMWTSADANAAVPFSAPWAEKHAQGIVAVNGEWNWEYGIHRDMIAEAEEIRDRMLLAIYGSFSLAKKRQANANKVLNFCPYLLGKRESRRIMGDWVYSQKDVTSTTPFEDAIATGSWAIDLHYDNCKKGVDFLTTCKGNTYGRYWIPYRCIYSRNVGNLFVVGRCFSCTHVGLGGPRVINTLSQLGVAAGEAAAMCKELGETPRGIYKGGHVRKLQERLGGGFPGVPEAKTAGWLIVDDESEDVEFGKGWRKMHNANGDQVGDWYHKAADKSSETVVYPLPVKESGRYALMGKVPYLWFAKPGAKTMLEISSGGRTKAFTADPAQSTGQWVKLGEFDLEPGATLSIIPAKSSGLIVADGFALIRK
ncbi:MAG: FAD-dependent oxidoreductase [Kiritimatiellae bacterium]|nr:FAD-dependent oxidoreductase [Kiritimatiellia bacterium]